MKAVVVEHVGERGTLKEVPDIIPMRREVLIRVTVAGVNPVDWKLRDLYGHPLPFILGQDFAGIVIDTGPDVHDYRIGERIFGIARQHGAYAERTIISIDDPAAPVSKIPDAVGDADAAGLPTPGLTALACADRIPPNLQSPVLIIGVTGGVGQLLAQICRARGLQTVGVGREKNRDMAQQLGVQSYIANEGSDVNAFVENALREHPGRFACVIDLVHTDRQIEAVTKLVQEGGSLFSTIRAINETEMKKRGINGLNVNLDGAPTSNHQGLKTLAKMVENGSLRVPITAERDLHDAVDALDQLKAGSISGKLIVTIDR